MRSRSGRLRARLGRLRSALARPATLFFAAALIVLVVMFSCNTNTKDHTTPRGDGKYRPILARGDGHMIYLMTRSLVFDRDLVFDNDLARFGDPWRQPRTKTGRKMIPHPIGPVLVQAPFLILAHGASKVANLFGADIPSHGYTAFHQRIVFFSSVLFGFGTALFGFLIIRRWIGGRWAPLYGALVVLFGTSVTYYATEMPAYAHAMDAFFAALFVWYWTRSYGDLRWRRFAILGALVGVCALVRVSGFAFGIAVAVELSATALGSLPDGEGRRRFLFRLAARGALALGCALIAFTPQLIEWKLVFGQWFISPMGPRFMRLDHPQILETLFSSRNGWLSTHPIAYAGLVGLPFVPRRARPIALALGLVVLAVVWINSSAWDWWAGSSFGNRRLCSLTVVCMIGLGALCRACGIAARRVPRALQHGLAVAVLGWFVVWNMTQVLQLRNGLSPNMGRRGCCGYMIHPNKKACCKQFSKRLGKIAERVYKRVGNPFALPASLYFKLRYDVPIRRWDLAVGEWADFPDLREYNEGTYVRRKKTWNLPGPGFKPWLCGGFGPSRKQDKWWFRWTTAERACALVPLWLPDPRIFEVEVVPNLAEGDPPMRVRVRFDDHTYVDQELTAGKHLLRFEVPAGGLDVGMNTLVFESEPRPPAVGGLPNPKQREVGLAVGAIKLRYVTGKPAVRR